jgi:hypothetical protein
MQPITKAFPILFSLLSIACKPEDSFGVDGELGHEQFFYVCVEASDIQCLNGFPTMPDLIAVGGRFRLDLSASGFGSSQIEPASTNLVHTTNGEFEFAEPSTVAFLAFSGGKLSDFAHLTAAAPDSLHAMDLQGGELQELRLEVGADVTLSAAAFSGAEALAGGFRYAWSSANSRVLQTPLQTSATATVHGRTAGTTTLKIRTPLGLATELRVTVLPATDAGAPSAPPSGGRLDSGAPDSGAPDGGMGGASLDASATDGAALAVSDAEIVDTDAELPDAQPAYADAAPSAFLSDANAPSSDAGVSDGGSL